MSSTADGGLRRALKRYPSLIPAVLPTLLGALAGHNDAEGQSARASMDAAPLEEAWNHHVPAPVLAQLAATARNANTTAAATASGERSVAGKCHLHGWLGTREPHCHVGVHELVASQAAEGSSFDVGLQFVY